MQTHENQSIQSLHLEAPGDFLSGLLGVSAALVISLSSGNIWETSAEFGCWRLFAPLSGCVRITSGDLSWPIEEGQAAALNGGQDLSLLTTENCELFLLELRGFTADRVFEESLRQGGLYFPRGGESAMHIYRFLTARPHRLISAREVSGQAYQLLMDICGTGAAGPRGQQTLPPVVEAAIGILRHEYAFLDGIAELAGRLEVSQEYLTRCFCKYTGITPGKYLNRVRIENAKLLLRQGNHSVQFVSDACGFSNANYFARVFRGIVGMNPREYARASGETGKADPKEDRLYVL